MPEVGPFSLFFPQSGKKMGPKKLGWGVTSAGTKCEWWRYEFPVTQRHFVL